MIRSQVALNALKDIKTESGQGKWASSINPSLPSKHRMLVTSPKRESFEFSAMQAKAKYCRTKKAVLTTVKEMDSSDEDIECSGDTGTEQKKRIQPETKKQTKFESKKHSNTKLEEENQNLNESKEKSSDDSILVNARQSIEYSELEIKPENNIENKKSKKTFLHNENNDPNDESSSSDSQEEVDNFADEKILKVHKI